MSEAGLTPDQQLTVLLMMQESRASSSTRTVATVAEAQAAGDANVTRQQQASFLGRIDAELNRLSGWGSAQATVPSTAALPEAEASEAQQRTDMPPVGPSAESSSSYFASGFQRLRTLQESGACPYPSQAAHSTYATPMGPPDPQQVAPQQMAPSPASAPAAVGFAYAGPSYPGQSFQGYAQPPMAPPWPASPPSPAGGHSTIKEADRITFGPFPVQGEYQRWRFAAKAQIAAATGQDLAPFFAEMDNIEMPFNVLLDSRHPVFRPLDQKIFAAVLTSCKGNTDAQRVAEKIELQCGIGC